MDALTIFNCFEAVFWMTIGFAVFQKSRVASRHDRLGRIAAFWFVLFGVSDIFEVFTGAWYRPWPLLLFKAVCVVALIICGTFYRTSRRK